MEYTISVIIPVYNRAEKLPNCVNSVISQPKFNIIFNINI